MAHKSDHQLINGVLHSFRSLWIRGGSHTQFGNQDSELTPLQKPKVTYTVFSSKLGICFFIQIYKAEQVMNVELVV